ncbi:MAG: flavodoxin family protein [Anaerolineae bacterium]
MKAVLLDGSRGGDVDTGRVRDLVKAELAGLGWCVEPFTLHTLDIRHCLGCFGCWVQSPGECIIDDAAGDVNRAIISSDLLIFLTPLTFGGYSSELKKALDRCIGLISPWFTTIGGEIHHKRRYPRFPRLVGVAVDSQPDSESERIFCTLVGRNAINMHAPAHAAGVVDSSQNVDALRERLLALFEKVGVKA